MRRKERTHETSHKESVRNPVRAQREAGNSKATKRGFARSDAQLAKLIEERDELQEIEFDRLLDAVDASGILGKRFTKAELTTFLKTYRPKDSRPSKSAQLTNRLGAISMRQAQNDRKLDTRQKILLGAFLMDLLNEDEDARGTLIPKLKTFIKAFPRNTESKMGSKSRSTEGRGREFGLNKTRERSKRGSASQADRNSRTIKPLLDNWGDTQKEQSIS